MRICIVLILLLLVATEALCQIAPGNEPTDLELWLKADNGAVGSPLVTGWTDQSPIGNNAIAFGNPQFVSNGINYNPTVAFDAVGDFFTAPSDIQSNSNGVFLVGRAATNGIGGEGMFSIMDNDPSSSYDGANPQSAAFLSRQGSGANIRTRVDNFNIITTPGGYGSFQLYGVVFDATDGYFYLNGYEIGSNPHGANLSSETYYLGCRYYNSIPTKFMDGEIAEVVHYNRDPGASRIFIETYLALKYGITLDNTGGGTQGDYVATNGTIIWDADDAPAYHNNVIGIAREDNEGLYQKQSHTTDDTTRIYRGTLAATNQLNTSTIGNFSFAIIGDDQGKMNATAASNAEIPGGCGLISRLEREWRIERTSLGGSIGIDVKLSPLAAPGSVNVSELRLLVDEDGDFSNGGTTCYFNGDGSGVVISYSNPVVSISGISTTVIPANAVNYITIASFDNTTLPIGLSSFEVACNSSVPMLTWETVSELNNNYFTIERSRNGETYHTVTTVNGVGTTNSSTEYQWIDHNFLPGTTYYRLSQTDFDGTTTLLSTRAINCNEDIELILYPNPAENELQIVSKYGGTVTLVDAAGKLVLEHTFTPDSNHVKLNQVSKGLYIAIVVLDDGTQAIRRLVKR